MDFRMRLLMRRGWPIAKAEAWVDKLLARDRDRDDRRACIECAHLMRTGGCSQMQRGRIRGASTHHSNHPITDILMRCEAFAWQKS